MAVRPQSPSSSSSSSSSTSWSSRTTTLMSRTTTTTSTSTTMVVGRWWCLWWTMLLWHPLVVGNNNGAYACTVFLVGRDATVDGSVLVSHSGDGEFDTDPRLVQVPAQDHDAPGSRRPVYFSPESYPRYVGTDRGIAEYFPTSRNNHDHDQNKPFVPIGFIPQVSHTYAYLEETYGAVNEHSLAMGESTCSGVFGAIPLGAPNGTALFSIDELTRVAMERCTTARQAIQLMGDLAVQYGFYGAGEFEGTAESLAVTDGTTGGEAWIFHILPSKM